MIIQLRAAIVERIRKVQIQALQTGFIYIRSLPFYAFFIFDSNTTNVMLYNDVTRNSVTCFSTLRHVTENRYVKCIVRFFRWNIFYSLSYGQNVLTNRIAGKLMNIKKIKL